jgi:ParB-like chromosome segregation protein Spo0J
MRLVTEPAKLAIDLIDVPDTRGLWRPASRCSGESLAPLIQQIKSVGWVDAVIVRPAAPGRYELLDGEQRLEAERSVERRVIDAVIVHAEDDAAAAITLLCNLPSAELPAIHFARLVEWVRQFDLVNGGNGTNAEVGEYLDRDGSTVSRLGKIVEGLPNRLLEENGLSDHDLAASDGATLRRLADLEPSEKVQVLRELRGVKEGGGDIAACAQRLSAAMPAKRRRGRPARPFSVTDRSDGRFSCSVPKRPLDEEDARELLERLKPFLLDIRQQAGVASFDRFLGLAESNHSLTRAQRTNERMLLRLKKLRVAAAVKWQALVAAVRVLMERRNG